jgi:hypothetical protein
MDLPRSFLAYSQGEGDGWRGGFNRKYSRRIPKVVISLLFYLSILEGMFAVSRLEERENEAVRIIPTESLYKN